MDKPLDGCTVLIVEDEFLIMLDLQSQLEDVGAVVVTASSVAEGMIAAEQPLDAAILDVRLPDGDVFPVATYLTKRNVPIVFHSGHARSASVISQYPSAITLSKPTNEQLLINTVARQARSDANIERS